jgi:hypothetical protein
MQVTALLNAEFERSHLGLETYANSAKVKTLALVGIENLGIPAVIVSRDRLQRMRQVHCKT